MVTQEPSRSSQVVKSGRCCILSKKIISKQSIWKFKGDCDFLCYRLFPSTFLLLRFSILFLFLSCVYHPVFINPLTLTLFVRAHRRTGSYTLCKVDFSDVMSSLVICLPCVHNLSCMIHLISAKRGSVSNKINSCDTHCSGLLIPTTLVL